MASWLTEITKDPYDGKHLPKFDFKFVNNEKAIQFRLESNEMVIQKRTPQKRKKNHIYLNIKLELIV